MFAVIETGGKQYKVQPGDELYIEKLAAAEGETVTFPYRPCSVRAKPRWAHLWWRALPLQPRC